ncbi:MAG: FAD-dependent oxidoreductase [Flavobacteriaceae bacterium]|nr:MAG: FAD-dependent oxidoreductase [Flavobacteriaceae bacterium]
MKKQVDYIIVGLGLAGVFMAEKLLSENKSFVVIDAPTHWGGSSKIAAGLYNPLVLKRFTPVWLAMEQILYMHQTLERVGLLLGNNYQSFVPIARIFHDLQEKNTWEDKSQLEDLEPFMGDTQIVKFPEIESPFGVGLLKHSGRVDVVSLLDDFRNYLKENHTILEEVFDYDALEIHPQHVVYKDYKANKIIFCEGYNLRENPYFSYLPLDGNKGEVLEIQTSFESDYIWKSAVFLSSTGQKNRFYLGATYNWTFEDPFVSQKGKEELVLGLQKFYKNPFEVLSHQAAIRPTVKDRRPLLGSHPKYPNLIVFNGLGTRGVMLGPYFAKALYENLEHQTPLIKEADIARIKL